MKNQLLIQQQQQLAYAFHPLHLLNQLFKINIKILCTNLPVLKVGSKIILNFKIKFSYNNNNNNNNIGVIAFPFLEV